MALADEIKKLDDLRQSGALNEEEYAKAKAHVLEGHPATAPAAPLFGGTPVTPANIQAQTNQWAMLLHISLLAGLVIPYGGYVAPILIWQLKKAELPGLDAHGKVVVNWMISAVIYSIVCIPLCFVLVGFLLLLVLFALHIIFPIIGAVKASSGELWKYPLSITFLS